MVSVPLAGLYFVTKELWQMQGADKTIGSG